MVNVLFLKGRYTVNFQPYKKSFKNKIKQTKKGDSPEME